jgi:hypothetical protein
VSLGGGAWPLKTSSGSTTELPRDDGLRGTPAADVVTPMTTASITSPSLSRNNCTGPQHPPPKFNRNSNQALTIPYEFQKGP